MGNEEVELFLILISSDKELEGVYLLLVLQLGNLSLDGVGTVLAGNHSLETVKVGHVGASSAGLSVLGRSRGSPLTGKIELLAGLLELGGTDTTLDGDDELSEGDTLQVDDLTRDSMDGSVDNDAVTVDDLNDDGDLALLLTLVELDDATNLYETGEKSLYIHIKIALVTGSPLSSTKCKIVFLNFVSSLLHSYVPFCLSLQANNVYHHTNNAIPRINNGQSSSLGYSTTALASNRILLPIDSVVKITPPYPSHYAAVFPNYAY